jgi:hypothetical protein
MYQALADRNDSEKAAMRLFNNTTAAIDGMEIDL